MANYPRYAIYYAPDPGSVLDRFGAELIGYDAHQAIDVPFPAGMELPEDWHGITRDPRKYGFHATLKAPMALAPGRSESELLIACESFAAIPRAIPVIEPVVDSIDGFLAVIPSGPCPALQDLAADCVRGFDGFRAPLTEQDRARRNPSKLTPRQCEYLDRWGYPYVFEEFRFHMTLTGRLDTERQPLVRDLLRRRFREYGLDRLIIDQLALFRQETLNRRFELIGLWPLQRAAS